ncbi:zinc finger protein 271-like [Penaeus monodon]|uniref:zinc finger protein 271-like n=1 Tax=Penaeus monodon TaxID=6687 RepID=UPI0018A7ABB1|nr:zinc finger protein 271-like [Penaeus monodon]
MVSKEYITFHRESTKRKSHTTARFAIKAFPSKSDLEKHVDVHTEGSIQTVRFEQGLPYESSFLFGETHENTYKGESHYNCEICNKDFSSKSKVAIHMRAYESGIQKEKSYHCQICNKDFSENRTDNPHERYTEKRKPYSCEICN